MSELRDRIIVALATEDSNEVIADRILALLPNVPEFHWKNYVGLDCNITTKVRSYLGQVWVGYVSKDIGDRKWDAWAHSTDQLHWYAGSHTEEAEARAAVEAAVRKALGWEAVTDEHLTEAQQATMDRALRRSVRIDDGWRPIETVPTDGTRVDVWLPGGRIANCFYNVEEGSLYTPHGYPVSILTGPATHWRPLPAPPVTEE